ncbi:Protein transport protein Sec61 subunit gamma-2 [Bienertia sinuspersici]
MDALDSVVDPLREFSRDSIRLVKRCTSQIAKVLVKFGVRVKRQFNTKFFILECFANRIQCRLSSTSLFFFLCVCVCNLFQIYA